MLNDPVGAILAVLVFEAILLGGATASTRSAVAGFFETLGVGAGVGLAGAAITILALKRYWIPDFLQNAVSLMLVMAVFLASNQLKSEAGLLAVTVMGIALANQHWYPVRHIIEFKENLPEHGDYGWAGADYNVSGKSYIRAIDRRTGEIAWSHPIGDGAGAAGVLTTASGLAFTGDNNGNVIVLRTATGETLWHTEGRVGNAPITYEMDGRQIVVVGAGGSLVALALPEE
jgi:hypothetical protein